MDILDDMRESKLSATFFFKSELLLYVELLLFDILTLYIFELENLKKKRARSFLK